MNNNNNNTSSDGWLIELYFDVGSPYSWLAFEALHQWQAKLQQQGTNAAFELQLHPILLGAVLKITGNNSPMMAAPAKARYFTDDLLRSGRYYLQRDLTTPPNFPSSTMLPQRALTALALSGIFIHS